jgi:hypothetical protein
MDSQFFNLKKHWQTALFASAAVACSLLFRSAKTAVWDWLFRIAIVVLFVQFVWSGAYAIAALLSGYKSYFFQLILLCVFELSAISVGVYLYFVQMTSGAM